jgi:fatty acid desaturase
VHEVVVPRRDSRWHRWLGHVYALPSGLSFSQFRRWHLDHHDNLGTPDADPKRHSLSPRGGSRTVKALYFTPALFPIYFRAARREAAAYEPDLKRRIARERAVAMAFHLALPAVLGATLGVHAALALHVLPVFVVFPVAFALNRLGQHYDIDPDDPAHWGTLLAPSPLFWDRVFLWSNYHLEHHYFPRVPFYNLPRLHRLLRPFFDRRGIRPRGYGGLLVDWFLHNRTPHTDWRGAAPLAAAPGDSTPPAQGSG